MKKYFFYLSMALVAFVVASCGLKGNHTSSGEVYIIRKEGSDWGSPGMSESSTSCKALPAARSHTPASTTTNSSYGRPLEVWFPFNPQEATTKAPNEEVFEKFVEENKQTIIDFFTRAEMNHQITLLEEKHNNFISKR